MQSKESLELMWFSFSWLQDGCATSRARTLLLGKRNGKERRGERCMPAESLRASPAAPHICLYLSGLSWVMWPLQTVRMSEEVNILTGHIATLKKIKPLLLERRVG